MFPLPESVRIFVCHRPTDMRKSFNGLSILVQTMIEKDPLSGQMFVFFNKRRDRVKVLWWHHGGFNVFYRCLQKGRFGRPDLFRSASVARRITSVELAMIFEGIDLKQARKRPRWNPR
jgi:transposase